MQQNKCIEQSPYKLVAVDDSYLSAGETYVKIQVTGLSKTFTKSLREIYHTDWLQKFSKDDVAYLALLYASEVNNNTDIIKQFPARSYPASNNIMIIGILYCTFLVLSNLIASKIVSIGGFNISAALIFFPVTYIFDDILTEVYGFKVSRRVIWMGLIANALITFGALFAIYLPASKLWNNQLAYQMVFSASLRVFMASTVAYLVGEFINSIVLAKLKILTAGRHLWMRVISSTVLGVGIDTAIFSMLAYYGTIPNQAVLNIFIVMYLFKISYEIIALPITYKITHYLKCVDKTDHFDTNTKFNPFSLKL